MGCYKGHARPAMQKEIKESVAEIHGNETLAQISFMLPRLYPYRINHRNGHHGGGIDVGGDMDVIPITPLAIKWSRQAGRL